MNPRQFCVWLQGFLDACDSLELTVNQTVKIKQKLESVFEHEAGESAQVPSGGPTETYVGKNKIPSYRDPKSPDYDPKARC